ncbi:hypothetical protein [Kiloniella majae]|uniref:hypothetical protein n=1 Tax=Kiloniella majae TaxID=1938558 RepID=UPI0015C4E9ED|nr:hypothetical protein [Kiloniella majae]
MKRKKETSKATTPENQQCCGGTPTHNTEACCKADEIAKEEGQKGCGCSCSSPESA